MMIFLPLKVTADAEGGLKTRAHQRPGLQGFGGGQPPTSSAGYIPGHCLPLPLLPSTSFCRNNKIVSVSFLSPAGAPQWCGG